MLNVWISIGIKNLRSLGFQMWFFCCTVLFFLKFDAYYMYLKNDRKQKLVVADFFVGKDIKNISSKFHEIPIRHSLKALIIKQHKNNRSFWPRRKALINMMVIYNTETADEFYENINRTTFSFVRVFTKY